MSLSEQIGKFHGNLMRLSAMKLGISLLAVLALSGVAANAAILRQYDFASGTTASTTAANTTGGSFSSAGINGPPGNAPSVTGGGYVTDNKPWDQAINLGKYLEFTIGPSSPYKLTLTSLTFDGRVSGSLTASWAVRSSQDSYAANLGTGSFSTTTYVNQSTTLSGVNFTDTSSTITFRIYVWVTDNASSKSVTFDNVTLNGDVVPEPTTIAASIFGASFLAMAGIRIIRRRTEDVTKN
jgi:hypothetical protein